MTFPIESDRKFRWTLVTRPRFVIHKRDQFNQWYWHKMFGKYLLYFKPIMYLFLVWTTETMTTEHPTARKHFAVYAKEDRIRTAYYVWLMGPRSMVWPVEQVVFIACSKKLCCKKTGSLIFFFLSHCSRCRKVSSYNANLRRSS